MSIKGSFLLLLILIIPLQSSEIKIILSEEEQLKKFFEKGGHNTLNRIPLNKSIEDVWYHLTDFVIEKQFSASDLKLLIQNQIDTRQYIKYLRYCNSMCYSEHKSIVLDLNFFSKDKADGYVNFIKLYGVLVACGGTRLNEHQKQMLKALIDSKEIPYEYPPNMKDLDIRTNLRNYLIDEVYDENDPFSE